MNKFITILVSIFILSSTANASFMAEDMEPKCSLSGETYTMTYQGYSDTSNWNMPIAYDGECKKTPELSEKNKNIIYNKLDKIFKKHSMYGSIYDIPSEIDTDSSNLNTKGQKFVNKSLFPLIKKAINKEYKKTKPNTKKIALYHYIASTIGYDYYVKK